MVSLDEINKNINNIKEKYPDLCIDSIFLQENGFLNKVFYHDEYLHELRSCSKILVSMAVGIAIDKNMFSLDTTIYPSIENIVNISNADNLSKIKKWKIKNLLTHTTWYEKQMLSENYIKDIDNNNLLDYALNYNIPYEVWTRFAYNNLEPFILSVFFQQTFNKNLSDFIRENIFDKIDITDYKWDNYWKYCPASTWLYLKHSDFHKIGELILNDGKYGDYQVIPRKWIDEMCSVQLETPSAYKPERVLPKFAIGYYTFISRDGFIFRDGSNGQYIIVNKDKNLLITIMSTEKEMKYVTEILRDLI